MRALPTLGPCTRGVATLEMLLVLAPLLTMFFAVTQAGMLSVAYLITRHAAHRGARAAIVVLEDDPTRYGGEARGRISDRRDGGGASQSLSAFASGASSLTDTARKLVSRSPSRINAIRNAVYLPMALLGPAVWPPPGPGRSLEQSLAAHGLSRLAGGLAYNFVATAVTFPRAPGADLLRTHAYGPTEQVTVRVTYLFPCQVPIAAALMCDSLIDLSTGMPVTSGVSGARAWSRGFGAAAEEGERLRRLRVRLEGQEQAMNELDHVEMPAAQVLLLAMRSRFTTVRAEATLPIQGARYYSRSE